MRHLADAEATRSLGRDLAARWLQRHGPGGGSSPVAAAASPMLLLQGDLGAGKTCLVQGLAEGLGIREPVTSPTFALAQHYCGRLVEGPQAGRSTALVHLDLYRLEPAAADELLAQEEEEAHNLGALLAVEWPERLCSPPADAWWLELRLADPNAPDAGRLADLRGS